MPYSGASGYISLVLPSSSIEHIIPQDSTPRSLPFLILIPPGVIFPSWPPATSLWKNSSIAKKTKTLVISGPSATFEGQQYDLTLEGVSSENELPYLKLIGEGINSGKFLGIYPQGSAIPVRLANGKIDYAGQYDPTDKKKDRIILFNDYMSAQDIIEQVLYRELEEIF